MSRLVDHEVVSQDQAVDVLHRASALTLLSKGLAQSYQPLQERILICALFQHSMHHVRVRNRVSNKLPHRLLVAVCFLIHVEWVRCGQKRYRHLDVVRVTSDPILFEHDAVDGASLNYISGDLLKQPVDVCCLFPLCHLGGIVLDF